MCSAGVRPEMGTFSRTHFLRHDSWLRSVIAAMSLAIVTLAVYWPVRQDPFLNLDDPKYVTQNSHIADGVTPRSVVWAFTHGYANNWHPLTWISHAVDIQLFGFDPAPQHLENVILHAISVLLLFWVLKRATGYAGRSFMVAALFALHPVNVESVAWVAERKTMLSALFCLLALGAYRWYARKPGIARYLLMSGLFVLGLMSKPQIIMLPLVLLLWDYWPLGRMFAEPTVRSEIPPKSVGWLVKEKLPLFFICLVDAGVTLIAQHVAGEGQPYPFGTRIENAIVSYTRYLRSTFWPTHLALYYPHPGRHLHWWQVGTSVVILFFITLVAAKARHRYYIVGWLWFLIMLVPCIGLVQADVQGMADRYAYLSFLGLFIMLCWGGADWLAKQHAPRLLLPAVSIVVLAALALVTHRQIGYWRDNVRLWAHSAEVTTGNWKAEYLLGGALVDAGRQEEAIDHFRRAAMIEPNDASINLNIATYEQLHGNLQAALDYYDKALSEAWSPDQVTRILTNKAFIYRQLGDTTQADACLAKLRTLPRQAPNSPGAWWEHLIPMIKQYFHSGSDKTQS